MSKTIWASQALVGEHWRQAVSIEIGSDGKIGKVETDTRPCGDRFSVLVPSPPNLHSHAFQRAMAGMSEFRHPGGQDNFWSWRQMMFTFLDHLDPDDIEAVAAYAQMEMLETGFASVAEFHYLHHGRNGVPYGNPAELSARIAAAASMSGIGLTLLPALYEQGGCDGRPLTAGQNRFHCDIGLFSKIVDAAEREIRGLPADNRVGIAAHSLRAVSPPSLELAAALRNSAPFHIHVAEQVAEVEEVQAALGARPVQWLLDNASLDSRWCLIHCTHMDAAETANLARTGATVGLCPITESNLGDGIFEGVEYCSREGLFGIGSDSNIRVSLSEEIRTLDYSQRLRDRSRASLAIGHDSVGRSIFDSACRGGALAAGRQCGRIAKGKWADLIELNGDSICLRHLEGDMMLDAWLFAGDDRLIKSVWAAGRPLVQDGRHIARDSIESRYMSTQQKLRSLL